MYKFILPALLLVTACQQTAPAPSPSAVAESPSPIPSPSASPVRQALDNYFQDALKGGDGSAYWCEEYASIAQSFMSVTEYKVLQEKVQNYPESGAVLYLVQVASSNKGGQPIRKNWTVLVSPQKGKPEACVVRIRDADKYSEF